MTEAVGHADDPMTGFVICINNNSNPASLILGKVTAHYRGCRRGGATIWSALLMRTGRSQTAISTRRPCLRLLSYQKSLGGVDDARQLNARPTLSKADGVEARKIRRRTLLRKGAGDLWIGVKRVGSFEPKDGRVSLHTENRFSIDSG